MKIEGRWGDCKDNDGNIIIMVKTMIIIMIIMVTTMMMMMQSAILCCPLPGISQRVRLRLEGNKTDKTAGWDRLKVFSLSPWKQISSTSSAAASRLTVISLSPSKQLSLKCYFHFRKFGTKLFFRLHHLQPILAKCSKQMMTTMTKTVTKYPNDVIPCGG